eukprot:scaffold2066_cov172-Alexandrium_tamarense.AAC.3
MHCKCAGRLPPRLALGVRIVQRRLKNKTSANNSAFQFTFRRYNINSCHLLAALSYAAII